MKSIDHMHRNGIFHRDIKLENLLNDYDKTLKIVNFGLSNQGVFKLFY